MDVNQTFNKFTKGQEKADFVMAQLKQVAINSFFTFPQVVSQFQKNSPSDINKWKQNIISDINISASLGVNNIAPSWMRKYIIRKAKIKD